MIRDWLVEMRLSMLKALGSVKCFSGTPECDVN
jgi:hypothetical protein